MAHGDAMTILLPAVMQYNLDKCRERYGELLLHVAGPEVYAATPGGPAGSKDHRHPESPAPGAGLTPPGLPTTLSQTGRVKQEDFEAVARTALNDGAIIVNPAEADYDEILGILKEVWA